MPRLPLWFLSTITIDSIATTILLAPNGDNPGTVHRYLSLLSIIAGIILNQLVATPASPAIAGAVAIDSIVAGAIILAPNGNSSGIMHGYLMVVSIKTGIILNQLITAPASPAIAGVVTIDSIVAAIPLHPHGDNPRTMHR